MNQAEKGGAAKAGGGVKPWVVAAIIGVFVLFWLISREAQPVGPVAIGWSGEPEKMGGFGNYSIVIPKNATPAEIEKQAREFCAKEQICDIYGWTDPANQARQMPMLDREADAQAFAYRVNRTTNFERVMWDCRQFKVAGQECLSR